MIECKAVSKDYNGKKDLKNSITGYAQNLGAELIGFASVRQWAVYQDTQEPFYPQNLFPFTKTVIVIGVPVLAPMLDTTPSIVYSELYNTTNSLLDTIAYRLATYLNKQNYKAVFFPRDAYGDISVLVKKPAAAFSHVIAGKYAGLGTIGYNHTLLTPGFGPRVRLVSVLTDAVIEPDEVLTEELCLQCGLCKKCCPTEAFTDSGTITAHMDKYRCATYHARLKEAHKYPCGVCIKVCPVGKDRQLYGNNTSRYLREQSCLNQDAAHPDYREWNHIRQFGSE